MTFVSATILLFLVIDPLGGIPLFLAALKNTEESKRRSVIVRECFIAFCVLALFLFFGENIIKTMHLSHTSLGIAGGIILFVIALRIIFPTRDGVFGDIPDGEPFVVPLAIPLIAGPSAIATVLLLVSHHPERRLQWLGALALAVAVSTAILGLGSLLTKILGKRGISAIERLMGLVLTGLAVEMFLDGLKDFIQHLPGHS